jgi:hypothetical protein
MPSFIAISAGDVFRLLQPSGSASRDVEARQVRRESRRENGIVILASLERLRALPHLLEIVRCLIHHGMHDREAFASFDTEPVASGSIAQVHRATLHDGRAVAVRAWRLLIGCFVLPA